MQKINDPPISKFSIFNLSFPKMNELLKKATKRGFVFTRDDKNLFLSFFLQIHAKRRKKFIFQIHFGKNKLIL